MEPPYEDEPVTTTGPLVEAVQAVLFMVFMVASSVQNKLNRFRTQSKKTDAKNP